MQIGYTIKNNEGKIELADFDPWMLGSFGTDSSEFPPAPSHHLPQITGHSPRMSFLTFREAIEGLFLKQKAIRRFNSLYMRSARRLEAFYLDERSADNYCSVNCSESSSSSSDGAITI